MQSIMIYQWIVGIGKRQSIVATQQRHVYLDFLSTFEYIYAHAFEKSVNEQVSLTGKGIDVLGVVLLEASMYVCWSLFKSMGNNEIHVSLILFRRWLTMVLLDGVVQGTGRSTPTGELAFLYGFPDALFEVDETLNSKVRTAGRVVQVVC